MATPPKRGRGRPPLTEAEKKKREKRAQKAKEEAAAKREKAREKKRIQNLKHPITGQQEGKGATGIGYREVKDDEHGRFAVENRR